MLAVLDGGMCEWHACSNTQQQHMPGFKPIFHALYCEKILPDYKRNIFFESLEFLLRFVQIKSKRRKYPIQH
jgi:hypothetical protein